MPFPEPTSQFILRPLAFFENDPFSVWVLAGVLIIVLARLSNRWPAGWVGRASESRAPAALGLALALLFLAVLGVYALTHFFHDHSEPTAVIHAWKLLRGEPLYHGLDAAERYALLYGPTVHAFNALGLALFGASIPAAKLCGWLMALSSLSLLWVCLRRETSPAAAWWALVYLLAAGLCFNNMLFYPRADTHLFFWAAVGLWAALRLPRVPAALLCGLAAGAAMGCKVHGPVYFLPLWVLLGQRHGFRAVAASWAVMLLAAALPFLLFANVSLANYLAWLGLASRHGFDPVLLHSNLQWALFLLLPLGLAWVYRAGGDRRVLGAQLRQHRLLAGANLLALLAAILIGGKKAAGPHHLLPFVPVWAYLLARLLAASQVDRVPERVRRGVAALAAAFLLVGLAGAVTKAALLAEELLRAEPLALALRADLRRLARRYPHARLQMGYGRHNASYILTWMRPELEFAGHACLLDPLALMDMQGAGLHIPRATIEHLEAARDELWLIPKGEPPFLLTQGYTAPGGEVIFEPAFRQAFLDRYAPIGLSRFFEVWGRRPEQGASPSPPPSPGP
jgi:hypothetical protein